MVSSADRSELEGTLKSLIDKHFKWLKYVGMKCNLSKTELMTINPKKLQNFEDVI